VPSLPQPLAALLVLFTDLVQRRQDDLVEYLMEENRVLREQLGGRRLRLTDDQRRRPSGARDRGAVDGDPAGDLRNNAQKSCGIPGR